MFNRSLRPQTPVLTTSGGQTFVVRNMGGSLTFSAPTFGPARTSLIGFRGAPSTSAATPSQQSSVLRMTSSMMPPPTSFTCEICDVLFATKFAYICHLREGHRKLNNKRDSELLGPAPLACSRCKDRFYTYEGLERHLLMKHNLVTADLLEKAHRKQDNGKCKTCGKVYAFNLLQHLVQDHRQQLCSAEILYSCDVCPFQCKSYVLLENHLASVHAPASTMGPPNNFSQQQRAIRPNQRFPLIRAPSNNSPQMNNLKRPLPTNDASMATRPKAPRMQTGIGAQPTLYRSAAQAQQGSPRVARPQQVTPKVTQQQQAKKNVKYCCTPCNLKFAVYNDVLEHWAERHLDKVEIRACRVDQCERCKNELAGDGKLSLDFCHHVYDDPILRQSADNDDDLQIISEHNSNDDAELICLD